MAAFVTFEDVSKVYHSGEIEIRAVDHISFTIEKGEFCVIVGPSGAGKTTVLNMLGGMDACSGGTAARRHRPRAGEKSEAPALRRADRRARLCDRQADPQALAGHLPAKGCDGRGHHAQQRHHADGRPRHPHQKRHGGEYAVQ